MKKTHFLQFFTKKHNEIQLQIISSNSIITNINSTNYLGLIIDGTLLWKEHINELTSKLNKACYAVRAIKPFMSLDVLKIIYYAYVHSVMSYGIIFGGNSYFSDIIFKVQKRIIRVISGSGRWDSCHDLFRKFQILPLPSLYIFSLLVFVNKNGNCFTSNCEVHDFNTRFSQNLHLPSTNLSLVQRGVLFSRSKIYNHLPLNIKILSNDPDRFKFALKTYLAKHAFYSLDEYYNLYSY